MKRLVLLLILLSCCSLGKAQQPTARPSQLPRVSSLDVPFYPPLARAANLCGIVKLDITTDGHAVTNVHVIDGAKVLAEAATKNVLSWKFLAHPPTAFPVVFTFRFASLNESNYEDLVRMLPDSYFHAELPSSVVVTSAPWPNDGDPAPNPR